MPRPTLFFFLLFMVANSFVLAQNTQKNLVKNPGFEEFISESDGHSYMDNVIGWFDIVLDTTAEHYATPDHLFDTNKNNLRQYRPYFKPYEGLSCGGIITYMTRLWNYREYLTVPLSSPLVPGQEYICSYYITNGVGETFAGIGVDGIGVWLGTKQPNQITYEPLRVEPMYQSQNILYLDQWKREYFTFKADSAYAYLCIGNFTTDDRIHYRQFKEEIDPQAYYFVDQVSIERVPTPVTLHAIRKPVFQQAKQEEVVAIAPVQEKASQEDEMIRKILTHKSKSQPMSLKGRVVFQQNKVKVSSDEVLIKVWDKKEVDGDVISIQFNGEWVLENHSLTKRKKIIHLTLDPEANNFLIMYAHNVGKNPPNTAAFSIRSGGQDKELSINSDMEKCGAFKLEKTE